MLDIIKFLGFTLLSFRFLWWVSASFDVLDKKWKRVLFAQCVEGLLLLFIFSQLFGQQKYLPFATTVGSLTIGFFLVCVGVGGAFLAKRELGSAWVYAVSYKVKPQQHLVTTGIYSLIRHPIYVSFAISYIGIEILAGTWLWVACLFFFIPVYLQARREENLLQNHFGKKYTLYQQKTSMFVPWFF